MSATLLRMVLLAAVGGLSLRSFAATGEEAAEFQTMEELELENIALEESVGNLDDEIARLNGEIERLNEELGESVTRVKFMELNLAKVRSELDAANTRAEYAEKAAAQSEQIVQDVKVHNRYLWWAIAVFAAVFVILALSRLRRLRII